MNPSTFVIGVSSLKSEELGIIQLPDMIIGKNSAQLEYDLDKAMQEYIKLRV